MTGRIRAKGKCLSCDRPFVDVSRGISMHKNLGIICTSCRSVPQRLYLDLHHKGKRLRIFSDRQGNPLDRYHKAAMLLTEINNEIRLNRFKASEFSGKGSRKSSVSVLIDGFLADKIDAIAPSHRRHYCRYGEFVRSYFGERDVRGIGKKELEGFREFLKKRYEFSDRTLKNALDYLKTFLRYCKKELKVLDDVPAFPEVELTARRHSWVCREDQRFLLEQAADSDRPILAFMMLHGCRPSEARALQCRDVDLQTGTITVSGSFSGNVYRPGREGKQERHMSIPIHPEMLDYLSVRVKSELPEAYVFINRRTGTFYSASALDRAWFDARKRAGLGKGVRLYDVTRQSFASQLVSGVASPSIVSRLLGKAGIQPAGKHEKQYIQSLNTGINPPA